MINKEFLLETMLDILVKGREINKEAKRLDIDDMELRYCFCTQLDCLE